MATLAPRSFEIPFNVHDSDPGKVYDDKLAAFAKRTKDARPGDELAGEILRFQVADGYAVYVVQSSSPLRLVHVDGLDGYMVPGAMIRGLRVGDVRRMVEAERRLAELFARRAEVKS